MLRRAVSKESNSQVVATCVDDGGQCLVAGHSNGNVTVWHLEGLTEWQQKTCYETPHRANAIQQITFARSNIHPCMVATAGIDGRVIVLAISSHMDEHAFCAVLHHTAPVTAVSFSDEGILAIRCGDTICLYECDATHGRGIDVDSFEWRNITRVDVEGGKGVSFAPGGKFLVAGDCVVQRMLGRWNWEVIKRLREPHGMDTDDASLLVKCLHWGSSGFISLGRENGKVEIWQLKQGALKMLFEISLREPLECVQWDRAGMVCGGIDANGRTSRFKRIFEGGTWKWSHEYLKVESPEYDDL